MTTRDLMWQSWYKKSCRHFGGWLFLIHRTRQILLPLTFICSDPCSTFWKEKSSATKRKWKQPSRLFLMQCLRHSITPVFLTLLNAGGTLLTTTVITARISSKCNVLQVPQVTGSWICATFCFFHFPLFQKSVKICFGQSNNSRIIPQVFVRKNQFVLEK